MSVTVSGTRRKSLGCGWILIVIAAVWFSVGYFFVPAQLDDAPGVVTSIKSSFRPLGMSYVYYDYVVGGQRYESSGLVRDFQSAWFPAGSAIHVYYDPARPSVSYAFQRPRRIGWFVVAFIPAILGVTFLYFGFRQ